MSGDEQPASLIILNTVYHPAWKVLNKHADWPILPIEVFIRQVYGCVLRPFCVCVYHDHFVLLATQPSQMMVSQNWGPLTKWMVYRYKRILGDDNWGFPVTGLCETLRRVGLRGVVWCDSQLLTRRDAALRNFLERLTYILSFFQADPWGPSTLVADPPRDTTGWSSHGGFGTMWSLCSRSLRWEELLVW